MTATEEEIIDAGHLFVTTAETAVTEGTGLVHALPQSRSVVIVGRLLAATPEVSSPLGLTDFYL